MFDNALFKLLVLALFLFAPLEAAKVKKWNKKSCRKHLPTLKQSVEAKWNAKVGIQIGICLYFTKKYREALKHLDRFKTDPKYGTTVQLFRARVFLKQGKEDTAWKTLQKVIKSSAPHWVFGFYFLGEYYRKIGKKKLAKKFYKTFIKEVKNAKKVKDILEPPEFKLKETKKLYKKAKKRVRKKKKKKRTIKEQQWDVNAPIASKKEDPGVWKYIYLSGRLHLEGDWKKEKAPDMTQYVLKDSWSMEEVLGQAFTFGAGPIETAQLVTRAEFNFYSNWLTEDTLIYRYFEEDNADFFFQWDYWQYTPHIMLDQFVNLSAWKLGYQYSFARTFTSYTYYPVGLNEASRGYQRIFGNEYIIPWVSVIYAEDFRTRFFYRLDYTPEFVNILASHRNWSLHLSQDIFFPTSHANLYFEFYYEMALYEASLMDHYNVGGVLAGDLLVADSWYFRLILGLQYNNFKDVRLRYQYFGEQAGALQDKDPFATPEDPLFEVNEVKLRLYDFNSELNVAWTFFDYHQLRISLFIQQSIGVPEYLNPQIQEQEELTDYDYFDFGAGIVYRFTYPDPDLIRRKAKYGFFGLF